MAGVYRSISACSRTRMPMQPDGDVVLFELEHIVPVPDSTVPRHDAAEEGRVIGVERRDGAPELLFQQQCWFDRGMRRTIVVGGLGMNRPAA